MVASIKEVARFQKGALEQPNLPRIKADPHADLRDFLGVSTFTRDVHIGNPGNVVAQAIKIPSTFRDLSHLSSAVAKAIFENQLEHISEEVHQTVDAETYMMNWGIFVGLFLEKAFLARHLLEAAAETNRSEFDVAAIKEIDRMSKMSKYALAFQRFVNPVLERSWAFDFVSMQLDQINNPMSYIGVYPQLFARYFSEKDFDVRRRTAIDNLKRFTDPLEFLRSIRSSDYHSTSLEIDLPDEKINLFVTHPKGNKIDINAVMQNAKSFSALQSVLGEIAFQAGRNRQKKTKIGIKWNPEEGKLVITDLMPLAGALYPFGTEPPRSRLYSIADRMGDGSQLTMWPTPMNTTISQIDIKLPDILVPGRRAVESQPTAIAAQSAAAVAHTANISLITACAALPLTIIKG
ncbi:MAG: hypothetical protein ABH871_08965 [Pseudomonadota bacterium]